MSPEENTPPADGPTSPVETGTATGAGTGAPTPAPAHGFETLSARRGPAGERVHAAYLADADAWIVYTDGSAPTDITAQIADLAMLGWIETSARDTAAENAALGVETIQLAAVALNGTWAFHAIDHAGEPYLLEEAVVVAWLEAAVAALITDGVAYEIEHPDENSTDENSTDEPDPAHDAGGPDGEHR